MALWQDGVGAGLLSARPSAGPSGNTGRLYYATDTFQWFRDSGTAWVEQDSVPAGAAGGDLVGTFPSPTLGAVGTAGTYTKVTTDAKGRVTAGTSLLAADIPSLAESKITNLTTDLAAKEATANKGTAGGYASLDGGGKVPTSQLPSSVLGAVIYQGVWNATTNSPALASGTGTTGNYYKVSVAGTTTLDGVSEWNVGDMVVFDGTTWDKIDNTEEDATSSVKGSIQLAGDLAGTAASPALAAIVTGATVGDATHSVTLTFDAKGRITAASAVAIAVTSAAVSDFTEAAQDATASLFAAGAHTGITFTYNDAGNAISAAVTGGSAPGAHASTHASGGSDPVSLDASQITGGTVAAARLGSGTANSGTFLRGDQSWQVVSGISANQAIGVVTGIFDGGGSVIAAGSKFRVRVPYAGTITGATVLLDQSGSIALEVRKCTYAQYDAGATHPQTGDKINASAPPTISAATKAQDSSLVGWTTAVTAGDIIEFYVSSVTSATWCEIQLDIAKS